MMIDSSCVWDLMGVTVRTLPSTRERSAHPRIFPEDPIWFQRFDLGAQNLRRLIFSLNSTTCTILHDWLAIDCALYQHIYTIYVVFNRKDSFVTLLEYSLWKLSVAPGTHKHVFRQLLTSSVKQFIYDGHCMVNFWFNIGMIYMEAYFIVYMAWFRRMIRCRIVGQLCLTVTVMVVFRRVGLWIVCTSR